MTTVDNNNEEGRNDKDLYIDWDRKVGVNDHIMMEIQSRLGFKYTAKASLSLSESCGRPTRMMKWTESTTADELKQN